MSALTHVGVVVPAANEQDSIGACLTALRASRRRAERCGLSVQLVVVLDSCTDSTAEVVAAFPEVQTVVSKGRNVGRARAAGAARVLRADSDPERMLLASTDADSQVPVDWIEHRMAEAQHAELVLGLVLPDAGLAPTTAREWHRRHTFVDGHRHVHGANLAVRASAYLAVGGWGELATGEDHDLSARVIGAGGRVLRSARAAVLTSARPQGRAPDGFAAYLRELGHRPAELA